ncbi:hypothetical protein GALMADRAFT_1176376 [Galerina marginata CBS 339.88]|uniref:Secreted protein n=1 Tax=Galerina marginata (strain CBS 339.88) TaxID=685588 RepID=A0A067TA93_GALM3|nr:hypothetical protein GALMADRAFT_1176376 [Galerina marginata CBS 339.88]
MFANSALFPKLLFFLQGDASLKWIMLTAIWTNDFVDPLRFFCKSPTIFGNSSYDCSALSGPTASLTNTLGQDWKNQTIHRRDGGPHLWGQQALSATYWDACTKRGKKKRNCIGVMMHYAPAHSSLHGRIHHTSFDCPYCFLGGRDVFTEYITHSGLFFISIASRAKLTTHCGPLSHIFRLPPTMIVI